MAGIWKISIVVMIALFGLVIAGSSAGGATLKGYVTDIGSGEGIRDVWIEAWNDTSEEGNSTLSETGIGYYEMNLSMGDFEFFAFHHEEYYDNITIDEMEEWYNFSMVLYAKVAGYVTDHVSEDPIWGVLLTYEGEIEYYYASTDGSGYYETYMPLDSYAVQAEETRHIDKYFNITIEGYEFWRNFTMDPLFNVMGYVWENGTEEGIPWAWMSFESLETDHHYFTSADDTGYYSAWVTPGSDSVWVSHGNYTAQGFNFTASEAEFWLNFSLTPLPEPDAAIMGYVTDVNGTAIEGAEVYISQYFDYFWHWDDNYTDEEGFYTLQGYSDETGSIEAWSDGYNENGTYGYIEGPIQWLNITLYRMINITVMGYVMDENETPLNDAYVQYSGPDWQYNYSGEDGFYTFVVHAGGKYAVYAWWEDLDFFGSEIVPEEEVYWLNITLHEPHSGNASLYQVSGYVMDLDTESPIDGAKVDAWSDVYSNQDITDQYGWFNMTVWAIDWIEIETKATGYYSEREDFDAMNINETIWLEPANASKYWIKGYVYDDETDEPIENATVTAESDVDENSTETDADGWYYMEILASHWIDVEAEADSYLDEEDDFGAKNVQEDFYLKPIPDNGTVAGIVTNETGDPIEGIAIALTFFGDGGDDEGFEYQVWTDENGSYEINGPAMLQILVAMEPNRSFSDMSYYPYVHGITVVEDVVIEHDIMMTMVGEDVAHVKGYVEDSEGDPVNDSEITLIPNVPGGIMVQHEGETDDEGYYVLEVPEGSYIVVIWSEELEEYHTGYLEVNGTTWLNVSLDAVINETSMEIYFENWEAGTAKMIQRMSGPGDGPISRLFIDMIFGDADGYVSDAELDSIKEFFEEEFLAGMKEDIEEDEDSRDDYLVDGVPYLMEVASAHIYAKGDVLSSSAVELKVIMNVEVNGTIEDADTHVISINLTGEEEDDPFDDFTFYIPTGFWLANFTCPDGVTVTGVSVLKIVANETAIGWLNLTVTSIGAPDPVVLADPTNIEGTSMDLSWTESTIGNFQKYTVYKSTKDASVGSPVKDITDSTKTEYTVTGLTPGVTYYFTVRAYATSGKYADSNQVTETTPTTSSPGFDVIVRITYTPSSPKEDNTVTFSAMVENNMAGPLTLTVIFKIDGNEVHTEENVTLGSGASDTLTYSWRAKKGTHTIEVRAESGTEWSLDAEKVSVRKKSSSTPGFGVLAVAAAMMIAVVVRRRRH
jgi:protocatechuate 3,4-dioxygenase beta subunit